MGKFLLDDCYVEIDGHDLSDHAFNIDTPSTRERVDVSGFNPTGAKEFLAGQKEDQVTVQFLQDFDTGSVHDILSSIFQNQATVGIKVRPTSAAVSAQNPELSGNVNLFEYNGLSGALSQRSEMTVTFLAADGDGLVWSDT